MKGGEKAGEEALDAASVPLVTLAEAEAGDAADRAVIHHLERDHWLDLSTDTWGSRLLSRGWRESEGRGRHLYRNLAIRESDKSSQPRILKDHIVRFPSAPIYGTNRKSDFEAEFPWETTHTLRALTRPQPEGEEEKPVGRLFIFHNGLNESENLRFYYRLADWILEEDDEDDSHRSACLIVPFPGHLTHAPHPGAFSLTPLLQYLSDSGELFRQFLRYMVEMRWLLSVVNRQSPLDWKVGGKPIKNDERLPERIRREWLELSDASLAASGHPENKLNQEQKESLLKATLTTPVIESTVEALENLLDRRNDRGPEQLDIHVIGYSLGGFLAQTVFFAWPNMVSSCATICSGGAIRALSPTAFAHPEEWQAVLHTLRPELEESMLRKRLAREGPDIAGMDAARFSYYQRIFDQVFLQEDHASYKARLSEYGTRMLFIGGGEDPIVRPREVIDASPKEGITMLSVANLTHFLGENARSDRETEQREFWLPEAGGLIARAAGRAKKLHTLESEAVEEKHDETEALERTSREARLGDKEAQEKEGNRRSMEATPKRPSERDLESPDFESALDWVIDGVERKSGDVEKPGEGWLFICRNGVPAAFLDPNMRRAWAAGLHHHDVFVQKYAAGLTHRAAELRALGDRMTLVLPFRLERTFVRSSGELVDPHSDTPGFLVNEEGRQGAWQRFRKEWKEQVKWFEPGLIADSSLQNRTARKFGEAVSKWQKVPLDHLQVTHIPDVWLAVDEGIPYDPGDQASAAKRLLKRVVKILSEEDFQLAKTPQSTAGKKLQDDLDEGKVRIVRMSAAELNPRYRGRFEKEFPQAVLLLAHCGATLLRTTEEPAPPD